MAIFDVKNFGSLECEAAREMNIHIELYTEVIFRKDSLTKTHKIAAFHKGKNLERSMYSETDSKTMSNLFERNRSDFYKLL